jgi:AcrR family transcriptional regulator
MAKRARARATPPEDGGPRQRALDATIELAEEAGVAAITLEAVAARAGLSKGGLLHYFPSKPALLSAMVEEIVNRYYDLVAAEVAKAPEAGNQVPQAYVAASVTLGPNTQLWTAVLTASLLQPSLLAVLRERARGLWDDGMAATTGDSVDAAIAWLAADGLWLSEMLGLYDLTPEMRAAIVTRLTELTDGG